MISVYHETLSMDRLEMIVKRLPTDFLRKYRNTNGITAINAEIEYPNTCRPKVNA